MVGGLSLLTTKNDAGWTPLHEAARKDAVATAKMLLENGADVNAQDDKGWTPLHWAARKDAVATATVLLENGADVNAKNNKSRRIYERSAPTSQ